MKGIAEIKVCPYCNTPCKLRAIASLCDPYGKKFGVMWYCKVCGWEDWGNPFIPDNEFFNDMIREAG